MPERPSPPEKPLCKRCGKRHFNVHSCEKAAELEARPRVQPIWRTTPDGSHEAGFGQVAAGKSFATVIPAKQKESA